MKVRNDINNAFMLLVRTFINKRNAKLPTVRIDVPSKKTSCECFNYVHIAVINSFEWMIELYKIPSLVSYKIFVDQICQH